MRLAPASILVVLGTLAPRPLAGAEDAAPTAIPAGIPIALDGEVLPDEWSDAAELRDVPGWPVVRVKQLRGTFLFAVDTDRPWPDNATLTFLALAKATDGKVGDPGTIRVDYEPLSHNRPHTIVSRATPDGWVRDDGRVVVRAARLSTRASIEGAVPLSFLGVATPTTPLRWFFLWADPTRPPLRTTYPPGLDLTPGPGAGTPVDFATTARWARTVEWTKPDGPGAFSKAEWDAWVAADREMTRRGALAHGLANLLREEAPERKKDAPIESDLLANLRWIGEREPLTWRDLHAFATGLWRLNRYDPALSMLEGRTLGLRDAKFEDAHLRGLIAMSAERFDEVALAFSAMAGEPGGGAAAAMREGATALRERQEALRRDAEARRGDETKDLPLVLLRTAKGEILLRLLEDDVPQAVAQFVHLVETKDKDGRGFYDGTLFHRVQANQFAQGGDPKSRTEGCESAGDGGSQWFVDAETNARHGFFRGAVGFATKGDKKNRSQFFIVTGHPANDLASQGFTCFATVAAGLEVAERLEWCDTLHSAVVLRKRAHPYEPKKNY